MNKHGIALIELIISMILIAVIAVVSTEFLAQYQRMASGSAKKIIAVNYARDKIEELYMADIDSWTPGTSSLYGMACTWNKTDRADYTWVTVTVNN